MNRSSKRSDRKCQQSDPGTAGRKKRGAQRPKQTTAETQVNDMQAHGVHKDKRGLLSTQGSTNKPEREVLYWSRVIDEDFASFLCSQLSL